MYTAVHSTVTYWYRYMYMPTQSLRQGLNFNNPFLDGSDFLKIASENRGSSGRFRCFWNLIHTSTRTVRYINSRKLFSIGDQPLAWLDRQLRLF